MILCAASCEVRRRVDDDRRVAQPDADGRLARHVGLANIDLAARDHDQVGALHQLGRHRSRDGARQELHQVRRQSDLFQLAAHAVDRGLGCLPCRRRRRDDDGVAPLQRHHGLVHGGGRWIGRRRDGSHDANRLGVFDKAFFRNFLNHARGLHPQQVSQCPEGLALVLDNLALDVADAGHFDGDFRQRAARCLAGRSTRPERSPPRRYGSGRRALISLENSPMARRAAAINAATASVSALLPRTPRLRSTASTPGIGHLVRP